MTFRFPTNSTLKRFAPPVVLVLASLFLLSPAQAQEQANEVKLDLVHPDATLIYEAGRVRYNGSTNPGNRVTVNGEATHVYDSGAFAGLVSLQTGDNRIVFEATRPSDGATTQKTLVVHRKPPPVASPRQPVQFDFAYPHSPTGELALLPGDELIVRFKGSPGMQAAYRIGDNPEAYPMRELSASAAGVAGVYEGVRLIQPPDNFFEDAVTCFLSDPNNTKVNAQSVMPKAQVTVLRGKTPLLYQVAQPRIDLFTAIECDQAQYIAPEGCLLECIGRVNGRLKFRLAPGVSAWVQASKVQLNLLQPGLPRSRGRITGLTSTANGRETKVSITVGAKRPFAIIEHPESRRLTLRLYGARLGSFWLDSEKSTSLIERIESRQSSDEIVDIDFLLRDAEIWGYRGAYSGGRLIFTLRRSPLPANSDTPLKGVCVVLDPGHGGNDSGALGSTGLQEIEANLAISRLVAERLEQLGAEVKFTLERVDRRVELNERVELAEKFDGDIFISIHNDSVGRSVDPLAHRGSTIFYSQPRCRRLSDALFHAFREINTTSQLRGVFRRDLRVTRRLTIMPSVLVECRFLSHPEDEMELLDQAALSKLADAIVDGLASFARRNISQEQ